MLRKVMTIAMILVLMILLAAPWVLAQQEDTSVVNPSQSIFDILPSFFCGDITGNPEDHCVTDENGVAIAPDGSTFTVENGIATFSDGRRVPIDRSRTGFLQYGNTPTLCAKGQRFGAPPVPVELVPCEQEVQ